MDKKKIKLLDKNVWRLNRVAQVAGMYAYVSPFLDGLYEMKNPLEHILQNNQLGLAQVLVGGGLLAIGSAIKMRNEGRGMQGIFNNVNLPPEHMKLVTTDAYERVRNPCYLGQRIAFAGSVLVNPTWHGILALATYYGLSEMMVRKEEELNEIVFGNEFREYKARVPRWIPNELTTKAKKLLRRAA